MVTNIKPLLTIAIPTVSSHPTLIELLTVLDAQLKNLDSNLIEIVISNNDPQDKLIKNVISRFKYLNRFLNYNSNEFKLSYDDHLLRIVQISNGQYIKFIADDDLLGYDFIDNYLILLKNTNIDIIVNEIFTFNNQIDSSHIHKLNILNAKKLETDFSVLDPKISHGMCGQLSSLTFRRNLIINQELKFSSNYIHSFWFFSLLENSVIYFISEPKIFIRLGSPNFSKNLLERLKVPLGGVSAIRASNMLNLELKDRLIRDSQDYVFKLLKAVPHLSLVERKYIFNLYRIELFKRPLKLVVYSWYFIVPKRIMKFLHKLKNPDTGFKRSTQ